MASVINLSDLSADEIDMLRKRADASFSQDGKTVTLPPALEDKKEEESVEDSVARSIEAVRKIAPPVPEDVARKLSQGFAPPKSSMSVTEDNKVVAASGPQQGQEPEQKTATPEDLADYIRCLLGGIEFTKTYTFMGGAVSATLRERSAAEEEDVFKRAAKLVAVDTQRETASMFLSIYIGRYRLAYALTELRVGDKVTKFKRITPGETTGPKEPAYAIDQRVVDIGALPAAIVSALGNAASEFSEITLDIAKKATDPKSWQTAPAV